jgi:peroxiredoxin
MARRFLLLLCLPFALCARADDEKLAPDKLDATRTRFLALVRDAAQFLQQTPAYAVQIACDYKTETEDKATVEGTNHYRLVWQRPGHFRIECTPQGRSAPELTSVCDGKTLTTLLVPRKMYSREEAHQPAEDLRRDALVMMSLEGSGIDLLLRPDLADHVANMVSHVQDLGVEALEGGKAEHFKVRWGDRDVELWLATEGSPVLRQLRRTLVTPVQGHTFRMTTTARLVWKRDEKFPADTFTIRLPEGARKVADLYAALVEGGTGELLGKPAPALGLKLLDGQSFQLASHKGKDVVVLLFWATWAAPGPEELSALDQLVKDYHAKGVAFYDVGVGQREGEVKRFTAKQHLPGKVVLDPRSESVDAYGLTALPCLVLVGKDGTVQAFCRTSRPAEREQLRKDLHALLKGEPLIPKASAR